MFSRSGYSRAVSADIGDVEQRLRALERRLEGIGSRSAAGATQAVDHVGDVIASTLSGVAEALRGRANSMGEDVAKLGGEAAKLNLADYAQLLTSDAAKLFVTMDATKLSIISEAVNNGAVSQAMKNGAFLQALGNDATRNALVDQARKLTVTE